jgi:ferredoxin-type protein NapH
MMQRKKRHIIQAAAAVLQNGYLEGFFTGGIYKGNGKHICVPGLNCYSCPGALGSCPIGSIQAVIGGSSRDFSYYVMGLILLFGVILGRLVCGFLCPFGFVQDLLHKFHTPKLKIQTKLDRTLRWNKFLMLAAVIFLPMIATDAFGIGAPYFCKYFCPAGTLEGGLPLIAANSAIRAAVGPLFYWKLFVLAAVIAASIFIYRPFCKYFCPLGAFYGLLNRISVFQYRVDPGRCTHCGACERACKMGVDVTKNINSIECIRCGECRNACKFGAISASFGEALKSSAKPGKPEVKH